MTPNLGFLKHMGYVATGAGSDTESILENKEDRNYLITIDNEKGKAKPIPPQLNVYMGGSKTKQGAGSGYVILKGKGDVLHTRSINLTGDASIFQAELIAVQEAAKPLTVNKDTGGYTLGGMLNS